MQSFEFIAKISQPPASKYEERITEYTRGLSNQMSLVLYRESGTFHGVALLKDISILDTLFESGCDIYYTVE